MSRFDRILFAGSFILLLATAGTDNGPIFDRI